METLNQMQSKNNIWPPGIFSIMFITGELINEFPGCWYTFFQGCKYTFKIFLYFLKLWGQSFNLKKTLKNIHFLLSMNYQFLIPMTLILPGKNAVFHLTFASLIHPQTRAGTWRFSVKFCLVFFSIF